MKTTLAASKSRATFTLRKETLKSLPVKAGVKTGAAGCKTLSEVTSCTLRFSVCGESNIR
jgi:hypothetical protein